MTAGFRVNNDNGIIQIDQNYSNMLLSRVVTLSTLPYDTRLGNYNLTLENNEQLVAVYTTKGEIVVEDVFVHYEANSKRFKILKGNAIDVKLYVFGEKATSTANFGIQVFDEYGECVFDSNLNGMKICRFGTDYNEIIDLPSEKKIAVCVVRYNSIIAEAIQGLAFGWYVPVVDGNSLKVTRVMTVNDIIINAVLTKEIAYMNQFAYFLVDVTNY